MTWVQRLLCIVEAYSLLLFVDIGLKTMGLNRLLEFLERRNASSDPSPRTDPSPCTDLVRVEEICECYLGAVKFYLRSVACLHRALVVYLLARRRGLAISFFIGVRKFPFLSHAWLESDGRVLFDEREIARHLLPVHQMGGAS